MAKKRPGKRQRKAGRKTKSARRRPRGAARKRAAKARVRGRSKARTASARRRKAGSSSAPASRRRTRSAKPALEPRRTPRLDRDRRHLPEADESLPGPPSSLGLDQRASAAQTGRRELREALHEHTETSPALTGGDVDADWEDAYSVGDEAPGGDNPTPDQDRVDDIGRALGVEYEDNEELKSSTKIEKRDRNRWELDPASAEDYKDR